MAISVVLIHVSRYLEIEVLIKLSKLHEITYLNSLFGKYNLMAKIEAKDYERIGDIIVNKIKTIDWVTDIKTLT